MVEKVLFWGEILEMQTVIYLHVLRSPETENYIFKRLVCAYGHVSVISITQKQIMTEISDLISYICITCRCYLKLLMKIEQKTLCTGMHKIILIHCLWKEFLISAF